VSASRSRLWAFKEPPHVSYPVIKDFKLSERKGSDTPIYPRWRVR